MSGDPDDTREQGIEFGALAEDIETESFPITNEELLDRYGDRELTLVDGSTTLREVLGVKQEQEYEDPEAVRQAILNMVGDDAVGREGYSDRGGNSVESDLDDESKSI
jgi:(p)ppGpp synthase/HD superfamily hydrolase